MGSKRSNFVVTVFLLALGCNQRLKLCHSPTNLPAEMMDLTTYTASLIALNVIPATAFFVLDFNKHMFLYANEPYNFKKSVHFNGSLDLLVKKGEHPFCWIQ
jgi:hypothetical protein